ncbi:flagellar hook-length control protein FliK [Janthinobacterium aquaticum]|uniref:flagellar hook-length control protein FliK n=1 Tax=Janthinobacterium sp. FT58W TaxID=2654254 RepID=UPI0012649557|nr:flagellar hook-length control protein FliK [Janthinobacterium sp. FT58W]KAB8036178.1 hypothetical protein GCM43_24975 [Janthinobacterium sp. FT58W]
MQTPLTQISTPNAAPAQSSQNNRAQPSASAPEGDFQRTLNRQLEQRQVDDRRAAQGQAQAQQAARQATPAQPAAPAPNRAAEQAAASQAQSADKTDKSDKTDAAPESEASEEGSDNEAKTSTDHASDMLALVGSIQLAMQQPAAGSAAALEAGSRIGVKADGKGLTAAQLLAAGKAGADSKAQGAEAGVASADDFAASLGQAQGKANGKTTLAAGQQGGKELRLDAGKLSLDAQLAATAKTAIGPGEALPRETPAELSRLAAQLQPGALQQAAAAAAVPGDKLMGRVGTPAWDQQLGQKVVWMAAGGDQSATLTLNPPDLGPLQVVLTVTNDQADAAFMSAQPEVRQALEAALPRLREMMSEAGIAFGNATVSAGSPEQQGSGERQASGRGGNGGGQLAGASGEMTITQSGSRARPTLGEVDTFA